MAQTTENSEPPVRSIARALDLLMILGEGPQSLKTIAERAQLSKATVHRLLASLAYQHFVLQEPDTGQYVLGPGVLRLLDAARRGLAGLGLLAQSAMEGLREQTGETVTLHVRIGHHRICIHELLSPNQVRFVAGIGETAPIHTGAAGKVLLAYLDGPRLRELIYERKLERLTPHTIVDPSILRTELELVRTQGWALSVGEREVGGAAVSAPVFGAEDGIVAAISALGPERRIQSRVEELVPRVLTAAKEVSNVLQSELR